MVQRNSDPVEFRTQDTRRVSAPDIGVAPLRANTPVVVGDEDWRGNLVRGLVGVGKDIFGDMAERAQMESYLEGQAAVGQVQSEDALEGNVFTRDWKVAGYRDTIGALQMADASAQLAKDMAELRTKPPEAMRAYLATQRSTLTPNLASMSRESRAKAFAKLMMHEQTAVRTHAEEHGKFILEQHAKAKSTGLNTELGILQQRQLAAMADAGLGVAYRDQVKKVAGYIFADLYSDPKLIQSGQRDDLVVQALEGALEMDNLTVYEYLDNTRMGEEQVSILDTLPIDKRNKLHKKYMEKRDELAHLRSGQLNLQMAKTVQEFRDGTFQGTWEDVQAMGRELTLAGLIRTGEQERAFYTPYFAMIGDADMSAAKATAFQKGDMGALVRMGIGEKEGAEAVRTMIAKRAKAGQAHTLDSIVTEWALAGRNGMRTAYKELAKDISPAISQLVTADGKLNPENAATFNAVMRVLDSAEDAGEATSYFLNGLPEEQRSTFQMIRSKMANERVPIEEAVAYARKQEAMLSGMSTQERAAMAAHKASEITKLVQGQEGQGHIMKALRAIGSIVPGGFGKEAALNRALLPQEAPWFKDSTTSTQYLQMYKDELGKRAMEIAKSGRAETAEHIVQQAQASMLRSTVGTKFGPLYLPGNKTPSKVLGLSGEYDNARIGAAIDGIVKPKVEGGTVLMSTGRFGEPVANHYDPDGTFVGSDTITGQAVQTVLNSQDEAKVRRNAAVYGPGTRLTARSGAWVNVRGANSAGVDAALMYRFRENLVRNEDVRAIPYDDPGGKKLPDGTVVKTYGVGVTNQDPRYVTKGVADVLAGKRKSLTPQEITTLLEIASNDAAKAAKRIQDATGLTNEPAFLYLAEMAYQGGAGALTNPAGAEVVRNMMAGNLEGALAAFKDTPVYKVQTRLKADGRIKHYEKLIAQAVAQHKLNR